MDRFPRREISFHSPNLVTHVSWSDASHMPLRIACILQLAAIFSATRMKPASCHRAWPRRCRSPWLGEDGSSQQRAETRTRRRKLLRRGRERQGYAMRCSNTFRKNTSVGAAEREERPGRTHLAAVHAPLGFLERMIGMRDKRRVVGPSHLDRLDE